MEEKIKKLKAKAEKSIGDIWSFPDANELWYDRVLQLETDAQLVYLLENFDLQMSMGGFADYYFNIDGQFARLAARRMYEIGAVKTAEIVVQSILILEDGYADDAAFLRSIRKQSNINMLTFSADLKKLSDSFFEVRTELVDKYTNYMNALVLD